MTIDEAIKILTDNRKLPKTPLDLDVNAAMELGIEVLQYVERIRSEYPLYYLDKLLGETKD